jgi:hypothetical protein
MSAKALRAQNNLAHPLEPTPNFLGGARALDISDKLLRQNRKDIEEPLPLCLFISLSSTAGCHFACAKI